MTFSEQTQADLKSIHEKLAQRVHEMTGSADAINSAHPMEVATLDDLRKQIKSYLR